MHDAVYAAQDGENKGAFARARLTAIGRVHRPRHGTVGACSPTIPRSRGGPGGHLRRPAHRVESTPTIDVNGTRFLGVPDSTPQDRPRCRRRRRQSLRLCRPYQRWADDPWAGVTTSGRDAGFAGRPRHGPSSGWTTRPTNAAAIAKDLEPELRNPHQTTGTSGPRAEGPGTRSATSRSRHRGRGPLHRRPGRSGLAGCTTSSPSTHRAPGSGIYTPRRSCCAWPPSLALDVQAFDTCFDDRAGVLPKPSQAETERGQVGAGFTGRGPGPRGGAQGRQGGRSGSPTRSARPGSSRRRRRSSSSIGRPRATGLKTIGLRRMPQTR